MTQSIVRTFLPFHRRGLAAALPADVDVATGRAQLPVSVGVAGDDRRQSLPFELHGPGDVIGLDSRQVYHVTPYPGSSSFDPTLLAFVELVDEDLPWRFTPGTHSPEGRLQPWMALVVVPEVDGAPVITQGQPLPVLTCPANQLPPAKDAWAWAHVQVTRQTLTAQQVLASDRNQAVARIICPTRLERSTHYVAALVPTFAAGRDAGLAKPQGPPEAMLADAWDWTSVTSVSLPVYHHWRFSTATDATFEALADKLVKVNVGAASFGREVDASAPGWGMPEKARKVTIPGLLRPHVRRVGRPQPRPAPPPEVAELADALRAAIDQDGPGAQIRPPIYGQNPAARRTLPTAGSPPVWLSELNLDIRYRTAAGLAANAVRIFQEDLVADAWNQLGSAAQKPLSAELSAALQRRFGVDTDTMSATRRSIPADPASPPISLTPITPAAPGTRPASNPRDTGPSTVGAFEHPTDGLAPSAGTVTLRRMLRAGGPLSARVLASTGAPSSFISQLQQTLLTTAAATAAATASDAATDVEVHFDSWPGFDLLASVNPEAVLPGFNDLPANAVVLAETDPAFAEAYLVGLNHEMVRELLWRRFPLDVRATMFRVMWPQLPGSKFAPEPALRDWVGPLGSHISGASHAVLLIRGELLRRYPTTLIYAQQGPPGARIGNAIKPAWSGRLGADATVIGFPITVDQLDRDDMYIVIEESATGARFGCDEPSDAPPPPDPTWQDLRWDGGCTVTSGGATHLSPDKLEGTARLVLKGQPEQATWGVNSAHMAVITQQPPVQVYAKANRWISQ